MDIIICFTFLLMQFFERSYSKLKVSELEWTEMNKDRTVDKILEQADLIESVTEEADWCQWIKVEVLTSFIKYQFQFIDFIRNVLN